MDRVQTLKRSDSMSYYCDSCDKEYQHKRSLDRHIKNNHIQRETTTELQRECITNKDNEAFVHQYLDFGGCVSFPLYLPESIQTLIIQTRDVHTLQYETYRPLCGTLTRRSDKEMLLQVVDEMFHDGIYNWGRIVVLFAIAIEFCNHARRNNYFRLYCGIPHMLIYALNRADSWIQSEGGWSKFVSKTNEL